MGCRGAAVIGVAVLATSCSTFGEDQPVAEAVAVVDEAVVELTTDSADPSVVLSDLLSSIENQDSPLAGQIDRVVERTAMVSGLSEQCVIDARRSRAAQDLVHIRDELAGIEEWDRYQPTDPPRRPLVCATSVETIEIEDVPSEIVVHGYDLDVPTVDVVVEDVEGGRRVVPSQLPALPDHARRVMSLGGGGAMISYDDRRIVVIDDGAVLAELTIEIPTCTTRMVETEPGSLLIEPGFTDQGDPSWQSDPDIDYGAEVTFDETEVKIVARLQARESRAGPGVSATGAAGSASAILYTVESGFEITGVEGTLVDEGSYIDGDTAVDELPGGGPISSYEISGQTPGADIGSGMQAVVHYNALRVQITQADRCAP